MPPPTVSNNTLFFIRLNIEKFPPRVKEKLQIRWLWTSRSSAFWFLICGGCDLYAYHKFSFFRGIHVDQTEVDDDNIF